MALKELRAIIAYIGKDNAARAKSFGNELRAKAALLADHPLMGRAGRPGLPADIRELVAHSNYIVFYRVLSETRTVEIVTVRHTARQV